MLRLLRLLELLLASGGKSLQLGSGSGLLLLLGNGGFDPILRLELDLLPKLESGPRVLSYAANLTWNPPPPMICSNIDELAIVAWLILGTDESGKQIISST